MAGSALAVIHPSSSKDKAQWNVHFSRFFNLPNLPSPFPSPSLLPRANSRRSRTSSGGVWLSSSSLASLHLLHNPASSSSSILSVSLCGYTLEEHFVFKLHFSWPQVSCMSGFPSRGGRALFVSYRDYANEIQKFALRFATTPQAESFICALKETLSGATEIELDNSQFALSSHSELVPSDGSPCRTQVEMSHDFSVHNQTLEAPESEKHETLQCLENDEIIQNHDAETSYVSPVEMSNFVTSAQVEMSNVFPIHDQNLEVPHSVNNETLQCSLNTRKMENHGVEGTGGAFPPSFTSLLTSCSSEVEKAVPPPSGYEALDFKSQIMKYMEDSAFQDMLTRVETVLDEIAEDVKMQQ